MVGIHLVVRIATSQFPSERCVASVVGYASQAGIVRQEELDRFKHFIAFNFSVFEEAMKYRPYILQLDLSRVDPKIEQVTKSIGHAALPP